MKYLSNYLMTFFLFTAVLMACDQKEDIPKEKSHEMKPGLIHTVFFWVKPDTPEEEIKAFENGLIKLGTCPQAMSYYWGPPAGTDQRGVVDGSYSYAINVHFKSLADHDAYQKEPIHLAFIEDHQAIWEKVIVYDNDVE